MPCVARLVPITLCAGLVLVAAASLHLGLRVYDPATVLAALRGAEGTDALIVRSLRVPRTAIAIIAGALLGLSGLLMQLATRNPLAEPGLLGVNAGAAFAVAAWLSAVGSPGLLGIGLIASAGAAGAVTVVFGLTLAAGPGATSATTLLAGVTVAGMLASLTQLLLLIDETALETLLFWLAGGFVDRSLSLAVIGLPALGIGVAGTIALASSLDVMRLDDDTARSLGVRTNRTRLLTLGLAAILAGSAVAMAGPVVFLGLVAPHVARRLSPDAVTKDLAVVTVLVGGLVALVADIAARLVVSPGEAPVGAVLALVGVPILIVLLRRRREVAL